MLRAPVFIRFRDDIDVEVVGAAPTSPTAEIDTNTADIASVLQQLAGTANTLTLAVGTARIKLSNLNREYWPGDARAKLAADHEARSHSLSRRSVAVHAHALARSPVDDDSHA